MPMYWVELAQDQQSLFGELFILATNEMMIFFMCECGGAGPVGLLT
jgi:hypothetical protein